MAYTMSQLLEHHNEIVNILKKDENVDSMEKTVCLVCIPMCNMHLTNFPVNNTKIHTDIDIYIYLDFAKAFQKGDMNNYAQINEPSNDRKTSKVNKSFISQIRQSVVVKRCSSSPSLVISGVPEGTGLGPLLFLIYLSDLGDNMSAMKKIYVEDTRKLKKNQKNRDFKMNE